MFLEHFGLSENPFQVTADPRYLYFGQTHRDAVSAAYLSILEGRGISALVAPAGMGKTTLLRFLLERLKGRAATALFPHPYRDRADLMHEVVRKVGLTPTPQGESEQMARLQERLTVLKARGYRLVLLFDEAQSLSTESLEQIRLLSNLRSTNLNLLDVVLAGQPELEQVLRQPSFEALRQRIGAVARVEPLDRDEVGRYIEHRLRVSGRTEPLFEFNAYDQATRLSRGIPRTINHLCHKALALAWADGHNRVSAELVHEAASDLGLPPGPDPPSKDDETPPVETRSVAVRDVDRGSAEARGAH